MKIDDILECLNRTLDAERKAKNIDTSGHFIYYIGVKKEIGAVKTFIAYVDFVNNKQVTNHVIRYEHTCNCPTEKIAETKDIVSLQVLTNLFIALRMGVGKGAYENYVDGSFEGWS